MTQKEQFLMDRGWKPVTVHFHNVWLAPVSFTGKGHYFGLEAAYELEANGEGIHAYSVSQSLCEAARGQDVSAAECREAAYHAATGKHHGQPPNY